MGIPTSSGSRGNRCAQLWEISAVVKSAFILAKTSRLLSTEANRAKVLCGGSCDM